MKKFETIKQVQKYADQIIPLLNLSHWEINIKKSNQDQDCNATCAIQHNYKQSDMNIHNSFWKEDKNKQRKTIIHELLHCHTSFPEIPLNSIKDNPNISETDFDIITKRIIDAEEECVELLARAFYKLIKLEE